MGALTSNRKRVDEFFSLTSSFPQIHYPKYSNQIDSPVSKKARVSYASQAVDDRVSSSKGAASRVYRYPESKSLLRREVHAPCRVAKFGFLSSSKRKESRGGVSGVEGQEEPSYMGNTASRAHDILTVKYEQAKKGAFDVLRYFQKDKEVIDFEVERGDVVISEDSYVEEVENIEYGREGGYDISEQRVWEEKEGDLSLQESGRKIGDDGIVIPASTSVSNLTKAENAVKVLDTGSLDGKGLVDDVPVYQRLLESPSINNRRLSELQFQINLHEEKLSFYSSQRLTKPEKKPQDKPAEDKLREAFIPLTDAEEEDVARAFSNSHRRKVLVTHEDSNIQITGQVLQCLRPGAWLNDEVINLYLELLKERERRDPSRFLNCHFFNTFFYKKLVGGKTGYDYKSVRRWTTQKKLGYSLLECDKVFVPIHKEVHWCLAVINKKDEKFQYLDSLGGRDNKVLNVLARYYVDEAKDKSAQDLDVSSWECEYVQDLPEQENGYDCGVFMIKYADFYSRGLDLQFRQDDMPYFRVRTAKEILRLRAD